MKPIRCLLHIFAVHIIVLSPLCWSARSLAAPAPDEARERQIRQRYEQVLLRNPFQERAFNQVFESYLSTEGVDQWTAALAPKIDTTEGIGALLLLGQIYDRQFKTVEAISSLEQAAAKGENRAEFKVLLGTLYYKVGQDDQAARLLSEALDALTDLDQRSAVCRMLGNLYLRQGKRDEAIVVWKRIAEQNNTEIFSQLELANIYEENRMWDQAIEVYRHIISLSADDPYRRCRALRSIGQCLLNAERHKEAIATFEEALGLVAPGNWLFDDLKIRLVGVYEDMGDLAGLVSYIQAKLEQDPADLEFRDLLAESYKRMGKLELAEKEYRFILERSPKSIGIYEKLIALYARLENKDAVVGSFEKLIELFPNETDYIRRLGEYYLRDGTADLAKATWQRIVKDKPTTERRAELAGWYEAYEFPDDAIATYRQAIEEYKNKEWIFRLAGLTFQKGQEAEALQLWLSVLNPDSSNADDYAEVAVILESNQKLEEAGRLRQQAAEKAPENPEHRLAYAKNLMRQKKFDEALAQFEQLAGQDENEYFKIQGESGRLDAYAELGILGDKQKEWERDLDQNPTSIEHLTRLARLYERAGQREKALQLHERRRDLDPDNSEFARALAGAYKSAKQAELAIGLLKELIEKDKNRARVYYKDLLDIYLAVDSRDEATAAAEKIVELAPSDLEARIDLAQVYMLYRQPDKAFEQYRYALRQEPNEPDYHRQYGEALTSEKRWGEAQAAFRKMLDVAREDQTRLNAVQNLTRIYLQQGILDELTAEFSRRVRNTPKKLGGYEELAAIYKESGQAFKAIEILENGLEGVDDKVPALKSLIRATHEAQDFPKARNYYEQLIALSGKPSPFEYERLGNIYAQMGDIEKAKEIWNKIIEESPKDPKAADRLSTILRNEGFTEEAIVVKAKAVDLDPYNYKGRFEYAQLLAAAEQPVQAIEQLQTLLELGEREEAGKKEASKEKQVRRLNRGQGQGPVNPYMFVYGIRSFSGGYYGGSWQGEFKDFKPQVIQFMANLAQRSIGEDAFAKTYEERLAKNPGNTDLKRDLLLIYQAYNRIDDALKLAEEILAIAPDDVDLLQQTALYYSSQQQTAKAIPLMEKLAEQHPKYRMQALQGLIPLYFQNKQEEKAIELANQLIEEDPNNIQTVFAIGSLLQRQGKNDLAKSFFQRALNADPRYRNNILLSLANFHRQAGEIDDAISIYKQLLLAEPPNFGIGVPVRRQVSIYVPQPSSPSGSRVYVSGARLRQIPPNVMGSIDYMKAEAMGQLTTLRKPGENSADVLQDIEKIARSYKTSVSPAERDKAWEAAKLLSAYYITEKKYDKASEILEFSREAGKDDFEWYNLSIYLREQQQDFAGMTALYEQLEGLYPARSREILSAKSSTAILDRKFDVAADAIRELNQQRVPPRQFTSLVQPLVQAGEKGLAKQLLEEHLAGVSRNSDALAMLARLCAEDSQYDRAIELASEAWERRAHGRSSNMGLYSGVYYSGGYYPMSVQTDSLLRELHNYHVAAGKSTDLVDQFKERLEKQPGSIQAHQNLAELYRMSNDRDKALEVYESLIEQRPHLMQVRLTVANLWTEKSDFKKATEIYEDLLKANPNAYQQISWQLRNLYQRIGKGKDLAKMEENMARKATNPNQIRQLASQYEQSGEFDKAEELYRKAITMSPMDTYMKRQLAEVVLKQGKLEEALQIYQEWLDAPGTRMQRFVDHYAIKQMVGLYKASGRIDELKKRAQADLEKNSADKIAQGIQAYIAVMEKDLNKGFEFYKSLLATGQDPNAINELVELAEIGGQLDKVLEILEQSSQLSNYYDHQRLARLYMAKGDKAKASEYLKQWVDQQSSYGGSGGYYVREAFRMYNEFGLYKEAEEFVRKYRSEVTQQYEQREIDNAIADAYVSDNRYSDLVDGIIKGEAIKGRDLDLIKAVASRYQQEGRGDEQRELIERLVEKDAANRELKFELARLHISARDHEKAIPLLKQLVNDDPNKDQYRESYADALFNAGRGGEAIQLLGSWAAEKPLEQRYRALANFQARIGDFKAAQVSWGKALELADVSKKIDTKVSIAEFEGGQGNTAAPRAALAELFETRKDAGTFQRYLSYLRSNGFIDEAHQFFIANKDSGYLDRYRNLDFVHACFDAGDIQTPIDLMWQFTRYAEYYNRDQYFMQVLDAYTIKGKTGLFLQEFQNRLQAETNVNYVMLEKLGDGYGSLGVPEKGLEVYNRLLKVNPFNRQAALKKTQLLLKSKRFEAAIKAAFEIKGGFTLRDEIQDEIEAIRTYFAAGHRAEAEERIAALAKWAGGGNTQRQIADLYFEEREYAKALPYYQKSRTTERSYDYNNVLLNHAKCLAKVGRADEALELWDELAGQENARYMISGLHNWLIEEGLLDVAEKRCLQNIESRPMDPQQYSHLAEVYLRGKRTDEALQVFQRGFDACQEPQQRVLLSNWASFITRNGLLEEAVRGFEKNSTPAWHGVLIRAFAGVRTDTNRVEIISKNIGRLSAKEPEQWADIGDINSAINRTNEAAKAYQNAVPAGGDDIKVRAIISLSRLGEKEKAHPLLVEILTTKPNLFIGNTSLIESLARCASDDEIKLFAEKLNELCLYPSHVQCYQALLQFHRGDSDGAFAAIDALTAAPNLTSQQLSALATFCKTEKKTASAVKFLSRLASEGHDVDQKWNALRDLIQLHAETGDLRSAMHAYAKMFPAHRVLRGEFAADCIANAVTSENLSSVREALVEIVRENPKHDRVSHLVGFYIQLAERVRMDISAHELIADLKLEGLEKEESSIWPDLIESWEIAGPYTVASGGPQPSRMYYYPPRITAAPRFEPLEAPHPPETEYLATESAAAPADAVTWKSVDAARMYGYIRLNKALEVEDRDVANKVGYARTTITSPDDRKVTFAIGSDDWVKVWVNGEEVHSSAAGRSAFPDQDRFVAELKKGANTMLIKLGNMTDCWAFCLRAAEGGEGVLVSANSERKISAK